MGLCYREGIINERRIRSGKNMPMIIATGKGKRVDTTHRCGIGYRTSVDSVI